MTELEVAMGSLAGRKTYVRMTVALGVAVAMAALAAPATAGAATSIPTAPKNKTLAATVPASVKSAGLLTALDATYAPDEFVAADGTTIIGMDADLATAIGQVLGLKVTLTNATFDTIIPAIVSGKFNLGASSFTDTKARQKQVTFVDYFKAGEGYYVRRGSSYRPNGLAALCGHTVAVESGTTEQTDAQTQNAKCKHKGKGAVKVLVFTSQNDANLAVSSGRAQVGFVDSQVGEYIVSTSNGQFANSGVPFGIAPYGLAVPKNSKLAPAVLGAVKQLMKDGIYTKILRKWGIQAGAIPKPKINGATS
jgi:polar amino acid transport system substrate-binding protein